MNVKKLKAKMVERGLTVEKLGEKISIDRSSMYRRLATPEKITIGEALRMADALELTDEEACAIFLK